MILVAVLLVLASEAPAAPRLTLTAHVPPAVVQGQALRLAELAPTERIDLAISLPLRNEAGLDDLLQELYDPASPSYHQYLSVAEFAERFGPASDDHEAVLRFAAANGLVVTGTRANRLVVDVEGPVAIIEQAFHVMMGIYRHPAENRTFYAPDREPTLELDAAVLHISGLDDFTLPRRKHMISSTEGKATGSGPHGQFIGSDMRAAYYGSGPLTGAGQSVGLFEFGGYELSDVQLYFQKLIQPLNVPVSGVSVNGARLECPPPSCDDSEQALGPTQE
jgi:subtilase family serine protease